MDMIRRAAGPTMNALIGDTGCWNSLVSAAEQSVPMIGIAPGVWQEGCQRMGRVETALSLLIIENASLRPTTSRWPPLRNPTAYLRGMIRRHEQGQLNLGHSIRKIARDRQLAKTARHGSW